MKTIKIEVIGSGCKKCRALFDLTKDVANKLGVKNPVEYSTDVGKIVSMGVMSSPVLAINDKPVLSGVLPDREKLHNIISTHISSGKDNHSHELKKENNKCEECKCDGNC